MTKQKTPPALVAVVMGSASDWETMQHAVELLKQLGVPNEHRVVSAHRTPELMADFAREAAGRGLRVIIAGAGGAAHLPGMIAAHTWLPVLGVPIESRACRESIRSFPSRRCPPAWPSARSPSESSGAKNAALLAASIIGLTDKAVRANVQAFRQRQTEAVLAQRLE